MTTPRTLQAQLEAKVAHLRPTPGPPPGPPGRYKPKTKAPEREDLQRIANLTLRQEWAELVAEVLADLKQAESIINARQQ